MCSHLYTFSNVCILYGINVESCFHNLDWILVQIMCLYMSVFSVRCSIPTPILITPLALHIYILYPNIFRVWPLFVRQTINDKCTGRGAGGGDQCSLPHSKSFMLTRI